MNKDQIMKSDVLDIIFENRNKAYGAYDLRKFYNNRLVKSLGLVFCGVVVLSAFTFLPKTEMVNTIVYDPGDPTMGNVKKEDKVIEKPKINKPVQQQVSTVKASLNIKIVTDKKDSADVLKDWKDNDVLGNVTTPNTNATGNEGIQIVGGGGGSVADAPPAMPEPEIDVKTPINNPEVNPSFPGGMDALRKFLQKNLSNPQDLEDGQTVAVKVKFVVGFDGKLQSFEVVQNGGDAFNNEVIRVLKKMPEWIPGKTKGKNVSVFYTIPVKFVPSE